MKHELRASDADRERTVERLRVAAGEGYLDAAELEERVTRALGARTQAALAELVVDLPRPQPATPGRSLIPRVSRRHALFGGLSVAALAGWAAEVGARDPLLLGQSDFPWPLLAIAALASAEALRQALRR